MRPRLPAPLVRLGRPGLSRQLVVSFGLTALQFAPTPFLIYALTRSLTKGEYGAYSALLSTILTLNHLFALGTGMYLFRAAATEDRNRAYQSLKNVALMVMPASLAIFLPFAANVSRIAAALGIQDDPRPVALALLVSLFTGWFFVVNFFHFGNRQIELYRIALFLRDAGWRVALIVLFFAGGVAIELSWVFWAMLGSLFLALALGLARLDLRAVVRQTVSGAVMREAAAYSLPLIPYYVGTWLPLSAALYLLARLGSPTELADLGFSIAVFNVVVMLAGTLSQTLMPYVFADWAGRGEGAATAPGSTFENSARLTLILAFVTLAGMQAVAPELFLLLGGPQYVEAARLAPVFVAVSLLRTTASLFEQRILAVGETAFLTVAYLTACLTLAAIGAISVPSLGALGAALALLGGYALLAIWIVRRGLRSLGVAWTSFGLERWALWFLLAQGLTAAARVWAGGSALTALALLAVCAGAVFLPARRRTAAGAAPGVPPALRWIHRFLPLLRLASMQDLEVQLASGWKLRALNLVKRSVLLNRLFWAMLRIYQNMTGIAPDEHRQLRNLGPAPAPDPCGKRVLVFTVRGWTAHLAWETTLARALHLRGARTLTVVCDGILPACEPRTVVNDFRSTCDRCIRQSRSFLSATRLEHRWIGELLPPQAERECRERTAGLTLAELRATSVDGLPVGRLVEASVLRHLLAGEVRDTEGDTNAYRRFVTAGLMIETVARRLLDEYQPEVILACNGVWYAEAILFELARARGIPVWTYERGMQTGSLMLSRNGLVIPEYFQAVPEARWRRWAERPLTAGQQKRLDEYLARRLKGDVGSYRLWPEMKQPSLDGKHRRVVVLFSNVLWDTAQHNPNVAFASMADWVIHTVEFFSRHPQWLLIVRIHPSEVRLPFKTSRDPLGERLRRHFERLPDNVRVIDADDTTDSYALLEMCDLVLVYTSTIGLEAAVRGLPVVVAGRTHYRGKGFTIDPGTIEEYDSALLHARRPGPEQIELGCRYSYMHFFGESLPLDLVFEQPRAYVTFRYQSNEDLAPGRHPTLDALCRAVLEDRSLSDFPFNE